MDSEAHTRQASASVGAPHRVVVTRQTPGKVEIPGAIVDMGPPEIPARADVLERARGAHILVTMFTDKVDAEMLDAAGEQLVGVCNFAVGVDNIDLEECRRRGIRVGNTPHAVTEGTADLAWTLIMAVARRLIPADRYARSPAYPAAGPLGMAEMLGQDLTGKTLHIVGAGRIGLAVAMRSQGWGMRVLYTARSRHWDFELAPLAARRVSLEEGLAQADVISLHTPLTPDTRGMINRERLALCKPSAIIVNTARGPIIDEGALVECLREKRIWGAGLDVFEHEPRLAPGLAELDNVVVTPHIGSAAIRYRAMMSEMVSLNAQAMLGGKAPVFSPD